MSYEQPAFKKAGCFLKKIQKSYQNLNFEWKVRNQKCAFAIQMTTQCARNLPVTPFLNKNLQKSFHFIMNSL